MNRKLPDKTPFALAIMIVAAWLFWCAQMGGAALSGDGARELSIGRLIATGKYFPLQGVVMSFARAHTGPAYYYLLALPNLIFAHPYSALAFLAALNALAAAFLFSVVRKAENLSTAFFAIALYLASPRTAHLDQAVWGVHHMPLFVCSAFYCLDRAFFERRPNYLIGTAFCIGILAQLNVLAVILLPLPILFAVIWKIRIPWKTWAAAAGILCLTFAPYLVDEIARGFPNLSALMEFVVTRQPQVVESAAETSDIYQSRIWLFLLPYTQTIGTKTGIFRTLLLILPVLILAGQALCVFDIRKLFLPKKWYEIGRSQEEEKIARRRKILLLAWFLWPVAFMFLYPGKIRPRYYYLALPVAFAFAGIAMDQLGRWIGSRTTKITGQGAVIAAATVLCALGISSTLFGQIGQEAPVAVRHKLDALDRVYHSHGGNALFRKNLFACSFRETDSRDIGFDYLAYARSTEQNRPPNPDTFLLVDASGCLQTPHLDACYQQRMNLLRFFNHAQMQQFVADHPALCPDFWSIDQQHRWQLSRERPFDKLLAQDDPPPPPRFSGYEE